MVRIFSYIFVLLIIILSLPFMILRTLVIMFWAIFGTTVISFFILALFGFALNECILYSGSLGFFVGVYLKYRDIK
jgi:hypothetical protein